MTPATQAAVLAESHAFESRILGEGNEAMPPIRGPITDPSDPSVPDDVLVRFEGEWCRWGSLTLQDRKAYMLGGYGY